MDVEELRESVLVGLGGTPGAVREVLAYGRNGFDAGGLPGPPVFPFADEPHVADWRRYLAEADGDVFACLQQRLPQLAVPVRAGVSATAAYEEVLSYGEPFDEQDFGGRLALEQEQRLTLEIRPHPAGSLPVLRTPHRPDFETLVQALQYRGEPKPVHPAVFAKTISGFNNWDRIARLRHAWEQVPGHEPAGWDAELERVAAQEKWRYQDRLMILCEGPYSGLSADALELAFDEEEWLARSFTLRVEHEFTHYATLRLFGRWSLCLLDELICDWAGMVRALGDFEARLFLRFLGLGTDGAPRADGRLSEYRRDLGDESLALVARLMVPAARGLEQLTRTRYRPGGEAQFFLALTRLTLEELASDERSERFDAALDEATGWLAAAPA